MTAVMIDDGKRVAADGARLQWHTVPIADIELIARNTRGEENGLRLGASHSDTATARTRLAQPPLQLARRRSAFRYRSFAADTAATTPEVDGAGPARTQLIAFASQISQTCLGGVNRRLRHSTQTAR